MSDYSIYYTESNIVCLILFGIMLAHDLFRVDRQEKQLKFDRALVAFMLYFITDPLWAGVISGVLPKNRFLVLALNFANFVLMAVITYYWLDYVLAAEQQPNRNRPINRFAVAFPFLVSLATIIVVYLRSPQKLISEDFELQPLYSVFQIAVPIIYIIAGVFYAVRKAHDEKNHAEKRRHLYIGFFPLMVILGGLVQVLLLPNTPIFCFSCVILMLLFYIQSMENQISVDPLTRLNNRAQLHRYISQKSSLRMEDRKTFVAMFDANDFKQINDCYGHAEGDEALVLIADSLRHAVSRHSIPTFLGRYGGDEFVLIAHTSDFADFRSLIDEAGAEVESRCRAYGKPYMLTVSVGYDELHEEPDSFQNCLLRADRKLYENKAARRRAQMAHAG